MKKNKYSENMRDKFYSWERKIHLLPKWWFFKAYDIFLCDVILEKYLPKSNKSKKLSICELGSWDWKLIKKIANKYNYEATWLEYSKEWVNQGLNNWVNTVLCDVYDKKKMEKFHNKFDIVFSYWFIEHITPVKKAIEPHLNILKPWWMLIMQIPRLTWLNYYKFKFFRPDLIPLHNLDLMEEEILSKECSQFKNLKEVFCKNYWTFKIITRSITWDKTSSWKIWWHRLSR